MNSTIGWRFPPTNGGRIDGYNDPGIAHFGGAPLAGLARETIQNSLDARLSAGEPVHVSFELIHLSPSAIGGDELSTAIRACGQVAGDDKVVGPALKAATRGLQQDRVPCLRISDRNTIGLRGDHWRALVKMQGVSHKPDVEGAGGSFGIGKYAPFAVSTLRTVFYWTSFSDNSAIREKCQGKSVLMSHEGPEGETQGTGFYGIWDGCSELTGHQIPSRFRLTEQSGRPVNGTSLVIAGFRATRDWRRRVALSVMTNFFYAIATGQLAVMLEPDEADDGALYEITQGSLRDWFAELERSGADAPDQRSEDAEGLTLARSLWEMSTGDPTFERQDADLGHCRLWLRVSDGLPSKVAIVRRTGMLITTRQARLLRFPGFRDFAAICVFEDPTGNELLRGMENPTHDQFEPDRLPEVERDRGRRALNRIGRWIRESIRKEAGPPPGHRKTALSELATYLPHLQPDEPFDNKEGGEDATPGEPGFGNRVVVTLKPIRRPKPPSLPTDGEGTDEGEADGERDGSRGGGGAGTNDGTGGSGGAGAGPGQGGSGDRGGSGNATSVPISRVRIVPIDEQRNRYRLSFSAEGEGAVRLTLGEAGDSSVVPRNDVRCATVGLNLNDISVSRGRRTTVEITADAPIGGRAWRLSATHVEAAPK